MIRSMQVRRTAIFGRWLDTLRDRRAAARVEIRIDRLRLGNPGDVKAFGHGVSEMRIDYGPGYRVYFIQRGGEVLVLLCGGDKSSQKRDIEQAHALAEQE